MSNNFENLAAGPADFLPRSVPLRGMERPASGEMHTWFLDLNEMAGSLKAALDDPGTSAESKPFTFGQLTFTRRFFLRLLLGAYLGIPGKEVRISRNRKGKPVLDPAVHGRELHFSIAKSGPGFLVGLSSSNYVGVDIEPTDRRAHNALGVAKRYFSETEASALASMESSSLDSAFLRTWACKEAVVKSLGLGIANQLCRFTVETDLDRPAAILDFEGDQAEAWWLRLIRPSGAYLGAVATRSEPQELKAFRMLPAGLGEKR